MKTYLFGGVKKTIFGFCFLSLLLPLAASAYSLKSGDSVYLPKGQTIEGNLYAAGVTITIEGRVTGDVICAGQTININGQVDGDVICAGQSLNSNGNIGGNLRAVGNSININGKVSRNVMAFGASINTAASSTVGWDMLTVGGFSQIMGNIGRDLYGQIGQTTIAGQIGKNVTLNFGRQNKNKKSAESVLTITNTAKINGEVKYTSEKEASIDSQAVIKGKVTHNLPPVAKKPKFSGINWLGGNLISIFSALVAGLVLISLWRGQIVKITDLMLTKKGASFGYGILALLLTPIIAILLLVTIIGAPLSLMLAALWFIAMYLSKILTGILLGRSILNKFWLKRKDNLILAMIIGIVAAYIIFSLPFLGWIVALLATLWGLGGIMLMLKKS